MIGYLESIGVPIPSASKYNSELSFYGDEVDNCDIFILNSEYFDPISFPYKCQLFVIMGIELDSRIKAILESIECTISIDKIVLIKDNMITECNLFEELPS